MTRDEKLAVIVPYVIAANLRDKEFRLPGSNPGRFRPKPEFAEFLRLKDTDLLAREMPHDEEFVRAAIDLAWPRAHQ